MINTAQRLGVSATWNVEEALPVDKAAMMRFLLRMTLSFSVFFLAMNCYGLVRSMGVEPALLWGVLHQVLSITIVIGVSMLVFRWYLKHHDTAVELAQEGAIIRVNTSPQPIAIPWEEIRAIDMAPFKYGGVLLVFSVEPHRRLVAMPIETPMDEISARFKALGVLAPVAMATQTLQREMNRQISILFFLYLILYLVITTAYFGLFVDWPH